MKRKILILFVVLTTALFGLGIISCGRASVKVTFDGNGGTPTQSAVDAPDGTTLPAVAAPERDGYIFTGWYTESGCTEDSRWTADRKLAGAVTVYAGWASTATGFADVTFSVGSGVTDGPKPTALREGSLVPEPEAPSKSGYNFRGWYKDQSYNTPFDFAADKATKDITLYAKWTKLCNITVKTTGEDVKLVLETGTKFSTVSAPAVSGKVYTGLYTDKNYTKPINLADLVEDDVTLYAQYLDVTDTSLYNIEYDNKYGQGTITISTKDDSPLDLLVLPEKVDGNSYDTVMIDNEKGLYAKRIVFPANVRGFGSMYNCYAEEYVVVPANTRYYSYEGCIYSTVTNDRWDDNTQTSIQVTTTSLSYVPKNGKTEIKIQSGTDNLSADGVNGKTLIIDYAPTDEMLRGGSLWCNASVLIVPQANLAEYRELFNDDVGKKVFSSSSYDKDRQMIVEGDRLIKYFGDKPVTVGHKDGITTIADDAFNGCTDITIGEDITTIEGRLSRASYSDYDPDSGMTVSLNVKLTFLAGLPENFADKDSQYDDQSFRFNGAKISYYIAPEYRNEFLSGNRYYFDPSQIKYDTKYVNEKGLVLVDNNKTLLAYQGDPEEPVTVGDGDGITKILHGAFNDCIDITLGADIKTIEGRLSNSDYSTWTWDGENQTEIRKNVKLTFLGAMPTQYELFNDNFWNPYEFSGAIRKIYVNPEHIESFIPGVDFTVGKITYHVGFYNYSDLNFDKKYADKNGFVWHGKKILRYVGDGGEIHVPDGYTEFASGWFPEDTPVTAIYFGVPYVSPSSYRTTVYLYDSLRIKGGAVSLYIPAEQGDNGIKYNFAYLEGFIHYVDEEGNELSDIVTNIFIENLDNEKVNECYCNGNYNSMLIGNDRFNVQEWVKED